MALHPVWDLQELEDAVVHLREDGEMNRKAGAPVLSSRTAGEPGKSVILLQNKPERKQYKPQSLKTRANLHDGPGWFMVRSLVRNWWRPKSGHGWTNPFYIVYIACGCHMTKEQMTRTKVNLLINAECTEYTGNRNCLIHEHHRAHKKWTFHSKQITLRQLVTPES